MRPTEADHPVYERIHDDRNWSTRIADPDEADIDASDPTRLSGTYPDKTDEGVGIRIGIEKMDRTQASGYGLERDRDQPMARVEDPQLSKPAYISLMTIYLGFAAFAAYEVALALFQG